MPEYENFSDHQKAFKEWKMFEMTINKGTTLDTKLQEQTMIWFGLVSRHINDFGLLMPNPFLYI